MLPKEELILKNYSLDYILLKNYKKQKNLPFGKFKCLIAADRQNPQQFNWNTENNKNVQYWFAILRTNITFKSFSLPKI